MARRSPGSGERVTSPFSSRASTTSVVDRGAIRRCSASSFERTPPLSWAASTRIARTCDGVTSYRASAAIEATRSLRATAPKASPRESAGTSSVTGTD